MVKGQNANLIIIDEVAHMEQLMNDENLNLYIQNFIATNIKMKNLKEVIADQHWAIMDLGWSLVLSEDEYKHFSISEASEATPALTELSSPEW